MAARSVAGQAAPVRREAARLRALVAAVPDPEIPVLTIDDLGILRGLEVHEDGHVEVTITPTYSGCPAMDAIREDIERVLAEHGRTDVSVVTVLAPAWTTDWMSERGRRKLAEYGVAPPGPAAGRAERGGGGRVFVELAVRCPRCGSPDTRLVSAFGSTACKAIRVCEACREPFDHFKAL